MGVSLLLIGLTGLFWFLGMRNADEVIGILEKLMATLLLVLTLCVGGWHLAIGMGLLVVALSLPRARAFASTHQRSNSKITRESGELFFAFLSAALSSAASRCAVAFQESPFCAEAWMRPASVAAPAGHLGVGPLEQGFGEIAQG